MTTITLPRAVVEQALEALVWEAGSEPALYAAQTYKAIADLRTALAQQDDPTDPGRDVDVLREHVRHLERRVRQLHAQQAEPAQDEPVHDRHGACPTHCCPIHGCKYMHDDCPVVSGAVKPVYPRNNGCESCAEDALAQQAEPVEPVAWRWGYRSVTTGEMDWRGYVEIAAHPNLRSPEIIIEPLYTAPPQRQPLTEEEAAALIELDPRMLKEFGTAPSGAAMELIRRTERAHGIGGQDER